MAHRPDAAEVAAAQLYAIDPKDFVSLRARLAKAAKQDGDTDAAAAIGALRKPTVPASVVNRYVLHDPDATGRLTDLGDRLRRATGELDAAMLRELSTRRRTTVADLTDSAFAHAGIDDPPPAQRDEVSATFDAAVADPDVAERLGRLVRPERFSGFGMASPAELTLVRGTGTTPSRKQPAPPPKTDTAATRRHQRAAAQARAAFTAADERFASAEADERDAHDQVATLTEELAQRQHDLDAAKRQLERARKESRSAKTARRGAQAHLDKAERQLDS